MQVHNENGSVMMSSSPAKAVRAKAQNPGPSVSAGKQREKRIRQQCHTDNSINMNMLDVETTIINNTFSSKPITWVQDNKPFFKAEEQRWKDIQLIVF